MAGGTSAPRTDELVCSARACRREAARALLWNNPRIHPEARRKVWLACDEHAESLGQYLGVRGFLKDTIAVGELTDAHG